jgi:2-oxoglutarate ferredoxin oxidoreductase subunit beta
VERPSYEEMMADQIEAAIAKVGPGSLEKLINSGDTWVVE